jgi:hypothetical protein
MVAQARLLLRHNLSKSQSALKLRFVNDVERCPNCGAGELKIIAAILERPMIEKILSHLGLDPQPARRCARQGLLCRHTASGPV